MTQTVIHSTGIIWDRIKYSPHGWRRIHSIETFIKGWMNARNYRENLYLYIVHISKKIGNQEWVFH